MTQKTKFFIFAAFMSVTSIASAKTNYELITEALQHQAARTLGSIATTLLSAEAKRVLLKAVAAQPDEEVATTQAEDSQTIASTEQQKDEASEPEAEELTELSDEPLDEQEQQKLAALLALTQKLNEVLAASQITANQLNSELDLVLQGTHETTESVV